MRATIVLSLLFLAELLGSRYCFANGNHLGLGLLAIPELATAVLLLTSVFATDRDGRLCRDTLGYQLIVWLDPKVETTGQVRLCPIFWELVFWIVLAALVLSVGGLALVFGCPLIAAGVSYLWRNFSFYLLVKYVCNTAFVLAVPVVVVLSLCGWWLFLQEKLKVKEGSRLVSFGDSSGFFVIAYYLFASVFSFLEFFLGAILYAQVAHSNNFVSGPSLWFYFWAYTGVGMVATWTTLGFLCGLPAFFLLAYDRSKESFLGKVVSAGWGLVCPVIEVAPVEKNRDKNS